MVVILILQIRSYDRFESGYLAKKSAFFPERQHLSDFAADFLNIGQPVEIWQHDNLNRLRKQVKGCIYHVYNVYTVYFYFVYFTYHNHTHELIRVLSRCCLHDYTPWREEHYCCM